MNRISSSSLFLIGILMIGLLSLSACDETDGLPIVNSSETFKAYVDFPVNSYWVFQDTADGFIDSVSMVHREVKYVGDDEEYGPCNRETIKTRHYRGWYEDIFYGNIAGNCFDEFEFYSTGGRTYFFDGPNVSIGTQYNGATYTAYMDSVEIQGSTYKEVKVFTLEEWTTDQVPYPRKVYFAKDIGIIYREMADNRVWELLRYKITP